MNQKILATIFLGATALFTGGTCGFMILQDKFNNRVEKFMKNQNHINEKQYDINVTLKNMHRIDEDMISFVNSNTADAFEYISRVEGQVKDLQSKIDQKEESKTEK